MPCAATIAGSDSGGGAGIQADLKAFEAHGVHGVSVITCLTAQHPGAVIGVEPSSPRMVARQWEAVLELHPGAVKTGMLYSRAIIERVADMLGRDAPPLIVDPVMVSTSGARLLKPSAMRALRERLLPMARLVTPNLDEAQLLTDVRISEPEDLRRAAAVIRERYGCAALVKGGHLEGREAIDVYRDARVELLLIAPRITRVSTHGTGCTYSAAIAARVALGEELPAAVRLAKDYVTGAIASSNRVGSHLVLNYSGM